MTLYRILQFVSSLSESPYELHATSIVNQAFEVLAISAGMDIAIIDPEDVRLRSIIYAPEMVLVRDRHCRNFTSAYRAGIIGGKNRF